MKKYGNKFKVIRLKTLRNKGVKINYNYVPKGTAHDEKMDCNIRRSKSKIGEYVLCNQWDYFVTLTLDKKKYNRYDLGKFHKDLSAFIKRENRTRDNKIKYLFVPEQHKDGAWHMHGFLCGLNDSDLRKFKVKEKIPDYIRNKLENGSDVFEWVKYRERFGFCDLEVIRSQERAASYVRKYITKELAACVKEVGAHMYYCSRGLELAKEIKRGNVSAKYNPTYSDEHVSVQWLPDGTCEQDARSFIQGNDITTKDIIQEFNNRLRGWDSADISTTPFKLVQN